MKEWTGLCTSCGDVWQEDDDRPTVCPTCGFTGVVAMDSTDPNAIELRQRHEQMKGDES